MDVLRGNETRLLKQRAEAMPRDDPRAEALLCGGHCPFANRFHLTISQQLRFTSEELTTALARKLGPVIPQLPTAVDMPLSNNPNSARKATGSYGDHVRTFHDTLLAYILDELNAAGVSFRGGPGISKNKNSHIESPRTSQTTNIGSSRVSSLA